MAIECNCGYEKLHPEVEGELKDTIKDPDKLEQILERLRQAQRDETTKTGHSFGCPVDIEAYGPGDWYGNCLDSHASSVVIPMSKGMLVKGSPNTDDASFKSAGKGAKMTGLFRNVYSGEGKSD